MALQKWEALARSYDPLKAGSIVGTDTIPHDHAIVRAMEADYKPNHLVFGDPKATMFVGRLNPSTEENTLETGFVATCESLALCMKYVPGQLGPSMEMV